MKTLSLPPAVRSLVFGCAVLAAAWLALALSASGTFAAAPSDPSPDKGSAVAPLASPTPWCGYDWRTVSSPNGGGVGSSLLSVAAVSATDVWAVGYQSDEAGNFLGPLAMHWNGAEWSTVPVPGEMSLSGVDAVATDDVWAVGSRDYVPGAVHWDGTAWTEVPMPLLDESGILNDVDARSASDVWAVGFTTPATYVYHVLILHWDGSAWSVVSPPTSGLLNAVYAAAADDVWAVGVVATRLPTYTLIVHWDGTAWTEVASGIDGLFAGLSDVSGLESNQVWAVGGYNQVEDGSRHTLILGWDGTSWTTVYDAALDDRYYGLEVITPDNIWAVGTGYSIPQLRRLHWNGSSWSRQTAPETGLLSDISGVNSGDIWAVGYLGLGHTVPTTLTQHYSYVCVTASPTPTATTAPTSTPTPIPPRCPTERFTDVCPSDYFYAPVLALSDLDILSGYNTAPPCDGPAHIPCFKPYNGSTRGQIAKVVSLAAGFNEPVSGQTFEDVVLGSTFWEYIERMASRDIIQGYPCGGVGEPCGPEYKPYFRPNNSVTRGQLSKMTSEAFAFSEPISGQTFEDVAPGSTFYEWVQRIASRDIIQGYPCGSAGEPCVPPDNRPYFRPNNHVTRGQTAKIVHLAMLEPTPTVTATITVAPVSSATVTSTATTTDTPAATASAASTSTPPTPQVTPTCCTQVTGSIQAACVGTAYQVTTTVTNSCGITLTANIATIFDVSPNQSGPWQTLYVGDCFSCPVPPGTQQQTSNVYSGPLPAGNNWWRYRKGYYSTNGCWSLNLVSEPQSACVTSTPTPAPRAAPGP